MLALVTSLTSLILSTTLHPTLRSLQPTEASATQGAAALPLSLRGGGKLLEGTSFKNCCDIELPTTLEVILHTNLTDQPLTDQPLHPTSHVQLSEPLTSTYQPLTDQPLTDQPLTDQPLTDQPLAYQPLTYQPLTYQPLTYQPLTTNLFHTYQVTQFASALWIANGAWSMISPKTNAEYSGLECSLDTLQVCGPRFERICGGLLECATM